MSIPISNKSICDIFFGDHMRNKFVTNVIFSNVVLRSTYKKTSPTTKHHIPQAHNPKTHPTRLNKQKNGVQTQSTVRYRLGTVFSYDEVKSCMYNFKLTRVKTKNAITKINNRHEVISLSLSAYDFDKIIKVITKR